MVIYQVDLFFRKFVVVAEVEDVEERWVSRGRDEVGGQRLLDLNLGNGWDMGMEVIDLWVYQMWEWEEIG